MTTPQTLKYGDVREDGFIFEGYKSNGYEQWYSPEALIRKRLITRLRRAKERTPNLPFDLDIDYVLSIWPSDGRCPVLGVEMHTNGTDDNSAELDRVKPDSGYVRGNVRWISKRANRIKADATLEELERVANYLRNCT